MSSFGSSLLASFGSANDSFFASFGSANGSSFFFSSSFGGCGDFNVVNVLHVEEEKGEAAGVVVEFKGDWKREVVELREEDWKGEVVVEKEKEVEVFRTWEEEVDLGTAQVGLGASEFIVVFLAKSKVEDTIFGFAMEIDIGGGDLEIQLKRPPEKEDGFTRI